MKRSLLESMAVATNEKAPNRILGGFNSSGEELKLLTQNMGSCYITAS
jgi:hypothetical protein